MGWATAQKDYSQRKACELVGVAPRVYRYRSEREDGAGLRNRLVELSSALWLPAPAYSSQAGELSRELEKAVSAL